MTNRSEGDARNFSRTDRCCLLILNIYCITQVWLLNVEYKNPDISDQCTLLLRCSSHHLRGGRPFKFFDHMADHEEFETIVSEVWARNGPG